MNKAAEDVRRACIVLAAYHKDHPEDVNWLECPKGIVICVFSDPTGMVRKSIEQQYQAEVSKN